MSHTRISGTSEVPVVGFAAPSGTGKTTLLRSVLVLLRQRGLRVGIVKQARDDFDVDVPGTDSFELRKAGIEATMVASNRQSALIWERSEGDELELPVLLSEFEMDDLDLILVEGFSNQPIPKIELHRGTVAPRLRNDPWVIALATDHHSPCQAPIPVLDINDAVAVADFLTTYLSNNICSRKADSQ